MTSIMRRTVRGTAAGLGALAIVAGTAACGGLLPGGEDGDGGTGVEEGSEDPAEEGEGDSTEEDQASEDGGEGTGEDDAAGEDEGDGSAAEEDGDGSAAEEDGDGSDAEDPVSEDENEDASAGEALSESDLSAAGDVFFEFLQAAATSDGEGACALVTNPISHEPIEGTVLDECAKSFEESAGEAGVDPAVADMLDRSMIEATDNGDGTAGIEVMGEDYGVTLIKAGDGQWYLDGSQFL